MKFFLSILFINIAIILSYGKNIFILITYLSFEKTLFNIIRFTKIIKLVFDLRH